MIYTVTLNPALDKTVQIEQFTPGAVNRITALRTDPGGKGINVSKGIAALGGFSVAMGLLGGNTGRAVADALTRQGLDCRFTVVAGETRTNLKIIDPVCRTNTDINEPGLRVSQKVLDDLLDRLAGQLAPGDIVVLAGSLPPGAPTDTYRGWAARCKVAGAKVFLDADGPLLAHGLQARPYLVKPNRDELCRLMGRELPTLAGLAAAARSLLNGGVQKAVVSLGGEGALFAVPGRVLYAPGLDVPVGSTVGAGDSMVAALALAEQQNLPLEQAARLAAAAGAASVMCSGSQAAGYDAVAALMPRVTLRAL